MDGPVRLLLVLAFGGSAAATVYAYAGYPLALWLLSRRRLRDRPPGSLPEDELPRISLLIPAYNEERVIAARLQNALRMDYPPDRLEIVVASDGSSDATVEIVLGSSDSRIRLLRFAKRRGKAAVLNAAFPGLGGEIVLLSDANTMIDSAAAKTLVRWFADSRVGVVCGRLVLTDPQGGRNVDTLYWRYETFLKRCEGRIGALLGANGAIYAIRKSLYTPIPEATIIDDFVIPLFAKQRTGCVIVYEPEATAREEIPPGIRDEFHRRTRIGAGDFQTLGMLWRLLDPRRGAIAFSFFSHKVLRWFCPFFLLVMLISAGLLRDEGVYRLLLVAQLGFYLVSALAAFLPSSGSAYRLLRLTTMFTSMNAALLAGLLRWCLGRQGGTWERTARNGKSPTV